MGDTVCTLCGMVGHDPEFCTWKEGVISMWIHTGYRVVQGQVKPVLTYVTNF